MSNTDYDVAIAGAGPAGCAAALRLSMLNLNVCLIDDTNDQLLKAGESLPGAALRLLSGLGIHRLDQLLNEGEYAPCTANVSAWGNEHWNFNDALRNPDGGGWHLIRHRFDAALRQQAVDRGITLIHGKTGVIQPQQDPAKENMHWQVSLKRGGQPSLPETIRCRWVVDATGRSSVLLRQLGIQKEEFEEQLAAICWLYAHPSDKDQTTRIKSIENGWWYSTRLPDNSRVFAFHGLSQDAAKLVRQPEKMIRLINQSDILPYKVTEDMLIGKPVGKKAGVSKTVEAAGEHWLAIGDSALSFDPLSSQGIFFALYSGLKGAEAIASCLLHPEQAATFMREYDRKVQQVFDRNQSARKFHYTSELRYTTHPYWQQYFEKVQA